MSNVEKQKNSNTATTSAPKYDDELEKTAFPLLLHEIISDPSTDYCIHWLSCGTRFMISDKKKFAKEVLPRFYGNAKFTSFTRRLKRWSFTRVPSGPFMGAYFNPNFRRGEPELAARVRYDHPTQLSGAAMQLNKAKLEALGATGSGPTAYHPGQFEASATTSIQQQLGSIPNEDRAGLLMRQMGMLNGGSMGSSMQQSQGAQHNMQAIYRMMQQNAIAQQQQQQQQQTASATSEGNSNSNMSLQMAMAQEMMQQRQQQQQQISPHGQQQLAMLLQNQVAAAQQGMPNQVSLPSFAGFQQGMGDGGAGSGGSFSNNQTGPSAGSLTTLTGGKDPNMTANGTPQLNFNSPYGMLGGGASNNPAAMNAFLAQYAQQGGVVPAIPPPTKEAAPAPTDGGGGNDKDGDASV